ncbi:MAG: hypothetical protein WDN44_02030 [Sphingomonas sp.]
MTTASGAAPSTQIVAAKRLAPRKPSGIVSVRDASVFIAPMYQIRPLLPRHRDRFADLAGEASGSRPTSSARCG